jgi:AmmeMemoRadiSam system protein B
MTQIRKPAVAGQFYPDSADQLRLAVQSMLNAAEPVSGPAPKALVVPHAGYIYSGSTAAKAYGRLIPHRDRYRRVILLGPCHYAAIKGIAASQADTFQTPLGDIPLAPAAGIHPAVLPFEAAHVREHSLEVQLPFLQTLLAKFDLLPLSVGDTSPEVVAAVIDTLWNGADTLLVISTDLSHFLTYDEAVRIDRQTCSAIERMDVSGISHSNACGAVALCGLLLAAQRRRMRIETIELKNSGDTSGDRSRVVGYGSWALYEVESCKRAA